MSETYDDHEVEILVSRHTELEARIRELEEQQVPIVQRATGRAIPDLTKREHVCEYQKQVASADRLGTDLWQRIAKAKAILESGLRSTRMESNVYDALEALEGK